MLLSLAEDCAICRFAALVSTKVKSAVREPEYVTGSGGPLWALRHEGRKAGARGRREEAGFVCNGLG